MKDATTTESPSEERPSSSRPSPRRTLTKSAHARLFSDATEEERYLLSTVLTKAIKQFILSGRAVYLDGLGVLFPVEERSSRTHVVSDKIVVRNEATVTIEFEKCCDLHSLHRDRFGRIVESRELASRIYPRLPLAIHLRWSLDDTKRYIQGLARAIRDEVVTKGSSSHFAKLGTFYSLHNRHGVTVDDWYAGADIFFESKIKQLREISDSSVFERPVLESSWELSQAAFGEPLRTFSLDCIAELSEVPLAVDPSSCILPTSVPVAVFKTMGTTTGGPTLIYITDGIRKSSVVGATRCELIFQVTAPRDGEIPLWPKRALAFAWLMLQNGEGSGSHRHGEERASRPALPVNVPLNKSTSSLLTSIVLAPFNLAAGPHRSTEGEFYFANVLGVTEDELALSISLSWEHLYALLSRKGLNQVNKPQRSSVIARTAVASPDEESTGRFSDPLFESGKRAKATIQ